MIDEAVQIALEANARVGSKKLKDFTAFVDGDETVNASCEALKAKVNEYAAKFPMPGFDDH